MQTTAITPKMVKVHCGCRRSYMYFANTLKPAAKADRKVVFRATTERDSVAGKGQKKLRGKGSKCLQYTSRR